MPEPILSLAGLTAFVLGVAQNATWDGVKHILGRFQRSGRIDFERLFLKAFFKAIDEHNRHYDKMSQKPLLELKRQTKQDHAILFDVLREFQYQDFGQFLDAIQDGEFQQQVAKRLHTQYVAQVPHEGFAPTVGMIQDTLRYYRLAVLEQVSNDEVLRLILLETMGIEAVKRSTARIREQMATRAQVEQALGYLQVIAEYLTQLPLRDRDKVGGGELELNALEFSTIQAACNSHTKHEIENLKAYGIYDADVYVERKLEKEVEEFLTSSKSCFPLIGAAGYGKTNVLCHLAESYSKDNIVLFLNACTLPTDDIGNTIQEIAAGSIARIYGFNELMGRISELLENTDRKRHFIVFVDAINEFKYGDPRQLMLNINHVVGKTTSWPSVKFIITCRTHVWWMISELDKVQLFRDRYYYPVDDLPVRIDRFDPDEVKEAYASYQEKFNLKGDFCKLSQLTQLRCRDPFMLKLVAIVYEGNPIPFNVPAFDVFDAYWQKKVEKDEEVRYVLRLMVRRMRENKTDHLEKDFRFLSDMANLGGHSLKDKDHPYNVIRDEGITYEHKMAQKRTVLVRFTYDRFFEYLLAREIEEECGEDPAIVLGELHQFQSSYGAVEFLLYLLHGRSFFSKADVIELFSRTNTTFLARLFKKMLLDDDLGRAIVSTIIVNSGLMADLSISKGDCRWFARVVYTSARLPSGEFEKLPAKYVATLHDNLLEIPHQLRDRFVPEGMAFLTRGLDGCLFMLSPDTFRDLAEKVAALVQSRGKLFSRMMATGTEVRMDARGRIFIRPPLVEHAAIEESVVIAALGVRCEIWSEKRWERVHAAKPVGTLKDIIESLSD